MNSGKSTMLLQSAFNYEERGMDVMLFIPKIIGSEYITSRIGLQRKAIVFDTSYDFFNTLGERVVSCILIDEAQFLTKAHVLQLCRICDELNIPVLCYGLRSDFKGEPFEGSMYLLTLADKLVELKTICLCSKKATMNMRIQTPLNTTILTSNTLTPILQGNQIEIGGNDKYISLCRKCYYEITTNK
jgi:thymidine kinase